MPQIPNCEEEIFISYAHIDNQPLQGLKGWVETLHETLQIRLEQLLGESVKIWRDRKLQGNDVFAETLLSRLSKVAVLVSILSPRYVKSEWCLKELNEFCKCAALNGGLTIEDKSRVFKVVKTHIGLQDHPPQLQGLLGYEFYEYDSIRGRAREFSPEVLPTRDIRYWEKLDDLAYDIKQLIETMQRALSPITATRVDLLKASGAKTVYLAETTSDLSNQRDLIKRELQQHGHVVLPDKGLPLFAPTLKEAVREYLKRSELSVHLIGETYGIIPEEENKSIVHIQSELAEECDGKLHRLIWMPVGLEARSESQRMFVDHFRLGLNGQKGTEVLQTNLEELKRAIEERTNRRPEPEPHQDRQTNEGERPSSIYLICDKDDMTETAGIEDFLFEQGLNVVLPAIEGDEAAIKQDHKDNLLECDGVIIYYGRANEIWLRMKQRELQKIAGYGRTRPLSAKAIYISAPQTAAKEHVRDHESLIVKNYEPFTPNLLQPFLEKMRRAKGV